MPVHSFVKKYFGFFKASWLKFRQDYLYLHAAALAFFTVSSLPPILVVIIYMASKIYDRQAVQLYIYKKIGTFIGKDGTQQLSETIERLMVVKPKLWATILGVTTLLFLSTTVFNSIKNSLNYIFKIPPKKGKTRMLQQVINRLLSLSLILGLALILFLSLFLSTYIKLSLSAVSYQIDNIGLPMNNILSTIMPFIVLCLSFAMVFKLLPDAKIAMKNVMIGGVLTTTLFSLGKYVISYIIAHGQVSGFYDAAGSLMAILLWAYYSSIIFLYGACFIYVTIQVEKYPK